MLVSYRCLHVVLVADGEMGFPGNFLAGTFVGRDGMCARRTGFCLEAQHFPDAPNKLNFPVDPCWSADSLPIHNCAGLRLLVSDSTIRARNNKSAD